jgi:hypothetical protein
MCTTRMNQCARRDRARAHDITTDELSSHMVERMNQCTPDQKPEENQQEKTETKKQLQITIA